jgi:CheY-like chemotaxis protein
MPILNGFEATEGVRAMEQADEKPTESLPARPTVQRRRSHQLNGRIPIFAVSASLREDQRDQMQGLGLDGWILKPVDFRRLFMILKGITDTEQREKDLYDPKRDWEFGGWLTKPKCSMENNSSTQADVTPTDPTPAPVMLSRD